MKKTITRILSILVVFIMCVTVAGCAPEDYDALLSAYENAIEAYEKDNAQANISGKKEKNSKKAKDKSNDTDDDYENEDEEDKYSSKKSSSKKSSKKSYTYDDEDYVIITSDEENEKISDLDGYHFVISSPWMATSIREAKMDQEKTFFKVAAEIEKEYGCIISVQGGNLNTVETLRPLIMSKAKVADCVDVVAQSVLPLASAGYIVPWNSVAGIDVTSNQFVQGYTNMAKIGNDYYGMSYLRAPEARLGLIFNKGLLAKSGYSADSLYKLVEDKKWTWDKFEEMAIKITKDNTSGGVVHAWGFGGWYNKVIRGLAASNKASLAGLDNNKKGVVNIHSANMLEAVKFMDKLINTDKVYDAANYRNASDWDTADNGDYADLFQAQKLAFYAEETFYMSKYLNKNFDYGMVPFPMGPKADKYYSSSDTARVQTLTSTNAKSKTIDKTVKIVNLLAKGCAAPTGKYEGEGWWQYDLKNEYFRNDKDQNLKMYMLCLDNAVVDYGRAVDSLVDTFSTRVIIRGVYCGGDVKEALDSIGSTYDRLASNSFTID